jgi:hypothetical protein
MLKRLVLATLFLSDWASAAVLLSLDAATESAGIWTLTTQQPLGGALAPDSISSRGLFHPV